MNLWKEKSLLIYYYDYNHLCCKHLKSLISLLISFKKGKFKYNNSIKYNK